MAAVWFHRIDGHRVDNRGRALPAGSMWIIGHDDGTVTWEPAATRRAKSSPGTFPTVEEAALPTSLRTTLDALKAVGRGDAKPPVSAPNDRPLPPEPPDGPDVPVRGRR